MIIYLPQKIYEKAKLVPEYNLLIEELRDKMFDGDLTSAEWDLNESLPPLHEKVKTVVEKIEKTPFEQVMQDVSFLMYKELYELTEEDFASIEEQINSLTDNVEQSIAQIYFLQYKCLYSYENSNYFDLKLRTMRKQIVEIFEKVQNEILDDETIATYHYQYFDLYMINLIENNNSLSYTELSKLFENFKVDMDSKTTKLLECKTSTQNSKLNDLLNHNKTYFTKFFYESLFQKSQMSLEEKVILDRNIVKYNKKHVYEYKNFNIFDLHFYWVRMKNMFANEKIDEFMQIFDELSLYIKMNLKNKTNLIRSLNFHTHVNHLNFLIFLHGLMKLDDIISEKYKTSKKLVDLNLSEKELDVLDDDSIIDKNSPFYINLDFIKSRLYG